MAVRKVLKTTTKSPSTKSTYEVQKAKVAKLLEASSNQNRANKSLPGTREKWEASSAKLQTDFPKEVKADENKDLAKYGTDSKYYNRLQRLSEVKAYNAETKRLGVERPPYSAPATESGSSSYVQTKKNKQEARDQIDAIGLQAYYKANPTKAIGPEQQVIIDSNNSVFTGKTMNKLNGKFNN
tara:strand:- start:627 stop:1175 length:549 start_codon:yes stop_codon:yes gene_type:complete